MVAKTDLEHNEGDKIKLIGAAALGLAGLFAFYFFAEQSLLMRTVGLLIIAGFVVYLVYLTNKGKRTASFFGDARTEVRKVVWPSRQETMQTTLTVFVIVVIVGIMLWLFDMLLAWLFQLITGIS